MTDRELQLKLQSERQGPITVSNPTNENGPPPTPLEQLRTLAAVETMLTDDLRHIEVYTMDGLLTLFWHGPPEADQVVIACGGAMGGVLGPADALYQKLGVTLGADGYGLIRVGYRVPNDSDKCVHDLLAAADLATRSGAKTFITMGHSFGGAPALQAAVILQEHCAGVVTLATQSAGCEPAEDLASQVPVILFHGDKDEILPLQASELVRMLIGGGELVPLPGVGHLLAEAAEQIEARLQEWIPEKFREHE
ncbi:MAG: hypothetical protein CBD32_01840 [Actinobacteria bacterium TMED172]|nr:MAG: hypothetical protein CBD32_01840 [Actinobacteria bacterium TMED172]